MDHILKLYNVATRQLEVFTPSPPHQVGLYVCGPTVYGPAHLGHARSAITFDLLRRYLVHLGYTVRHVRNITDVGHLTQEVENSGDDKIILQAKKEAISPMEVAQRYTASYRTDMARLHVLPPDIEPLATGHITEQIACIEKLLTRGYAYIRNGSVYFDMAKYRQDHHYGILSGRNLEEVRTGTRPLQGSDQKLSSADFALWKKADPSHIMGWPSPWGRGYPGWHLECATMSMQYLGDSFDIHGGGLDLALHHDCELAQATSLTGKPLARFWLHHNLVTMGSQKMSKSAQNFVTLAACFAGDHPMLSRPYPPMVIRFFLLHAHYRSPIQFSDEALVQATKTYEKLINGHKEAKAMIEEAHRPIKSDLALSSQVEAACEACYTAMSNDLNTTQLMAALFELLRYLQRPLSEKKQLTPQAWQKLSETYLLFLEDILGLTPPAKPIALIEALLAQYQKAKKNQRYDEVDDIRQVLQKEGIAIQDGHDTIHWRYKTI